MSSVYVFCESLFDGIKFKVVMINSMHGLKQIKTHTIVGKHFRKGVSILETTIYRKISTLLIVSLE